MNMNRTGLIAAAVCTSFALAAGATHAASVTYYLDQSNENALLPDGVVDYLSVTIMDGVTYNSDTGAVKFEVNILPAMPDSSGGSYGIDKFGFNTNLTLSKANIVGLPAGWTADDPTSPPSGLDGFGKFVGAVDGGGSRQNPTLSFYISGVSDDTIASYAFPPTGNPGQGFFYFAAHVGGFVKQCNTSGCVSSAYFGGQNTDEHSVVPVPAAVWLLGSALGLLGWVRRKVV